MPEEPSGEKVEWVVKNDSGEESTSDKPQITIGAKEAHYTPAFKFSSRIKEKCERVEKKD